MDLLKRRDNALFPKFCDALFETGHKYIVEDILRPNLAAITAEEGSYLNQRHIVLKILVLTSCNVQLLGMPTYMVVKFIL